MSYRVPFVNYPEHYRRIWDETMAALTDVLTHGDLIMRAHLREFEESIAAMSGSKYAVGLNSGTDAIWLSLVAAGIKTGDEVITVAHTFVATAAVIVHCGARPVLIDVGDDYNMDVSRLEAAITPRTRAVIPVHLNGRLCEMDRLMEIAGKHKLIVIEDAAQALNAAFDGKKSGSFGLTGCFSLYPAKLLGAAGDGGIVVTDDENIAQKIRLLRDHCVERATGDILGYGFNSRLDNLQAALLNVKLKYLPAWIERRREIAARYQHGLGGIPGLSLPPPPAAGRYYDVFTNYAVLSDNRDGLVSHLTESGVETIISWPKPMHRHPALGLGHFRLPRTEKISREVVSLPLYPELSDAQADFVIGSVRKFYRV
ncbi:MAG: DegT/DnrJ/EryC1/StrS family aminotransferase [Dehalococcoidales bacterium]|jgi:dTDP-4-amino-4,6-dideoxygalactose transaminase